MNKKVAVGLVVAVAIIVIGVVLWMMTYPAATPAVPSSANTQTETEQTDDTTTPGEEEKAAAATITYTDDGFSPENTTLKVGDTLKVVNNSSSSLEFSSDDHPTHTENPELNMGAIAPGAEGTITVRTAGDWMYHNHLNPNHTGTLVVTE